MGIADLLRGGPGSLDLRLALRDKAASCNQLLLGRGHFGPVTLHGLSRRRGFRIARVVL
jgi:hypothetical protein